MAAMTDDKVKRRLTTVLCADVYGYSRLMEADETGTLETLRRYRTAIARLVERHDGRIVNTWGDAVIAEFASVVEAVQCAVEIQQEIASQASTQASPMQFRIGINLGDVMVDGSDIYGDGVNIASRLQELAEPGGVVISSSVYDQVHNKLSVPRPASDEEHCAVDQLSVDPRSPGHRASEPWDRGRRNALRQSACSPVGGQARATHKCRLGLAHEAAPPACSGPHGVGFPDSDQSLHQPHDLVPLARCGHSLRCRVTDGAGTAASIGRQNGALSAAARRHRRGAIFRITRSLVSAYSSSSS